MNIDPNKVNVMVTGDDIGRRPEANEAIVKCLLDNTIQHASLMVNIKYLDDAIKLIDKYNLRSKIGLHCSLLDGQSLSNPNIYLDVDKKGNIARKLNGRRTLFFLTRKEKRFVKEEVEAQIKKYISLGFTPNGFDSHGHTHARYPVIKAILPILKKYNFKYVRIPSNINNRHALYNKLVKDKSIKLIKNNFDTVNYFSSLDDFINVDLTQYRSQIIEVMTHPFLDEKNKIFNRKSGIENIYIVKDKDKQINFIDIFNN